MQLTQMIRAHQKWRTLFDSLACVSAEWNPGTVKQATWQHHGDISVFHMCCVSPSMEHAARARGTILFSALPAAGNPFGI